VTTATMCRRPPHRGQTSTSMANTRFKRADQERPHEQAGSEPATALGPEFVSK
jgi:hypothetical protein